MINPEREYHKRLKYFFTNDKTSWGKVELVKQIDLIYQELLEDILADLTKEGHNCNAKSE